jgi:hypothetical protein
MSREYRSQSRLTRLCSILASLFITGALFGTVVLGLTGGDYNSLLAHSGQSPGYVTLSNVRA